jgi:hypothetical protein
MVLRSVSSLGCPAGLAPAGKAQRVPWDGSVSSDRPFREDLRSHCLFVASQLFGRHGHVDEAFGSEHGQCQWLADGVTKHQPLQRLGVRDGVAVCADQKVVLT